MPDLPPSLAGRSILVTGAGGGLGRAIAHALSAAGARVAALDRAALDVTSHESVATAVAAAESTHGSLDGLVCNAGVAGPTAPVWEVPAEEWEETLRVNLTGVFRCCAAALPGMVERRSGSVVVIGSMTGKRPLAGRTPYAASKLGLVGLVRTAALDCAPHGVRVNLVSPGPVAGPRLDRVLAGRSAREVFGDLRSVTQSEVIGAVAFLLSDAASGVTGEDLNVSAGAVGY